MRGWLAAAALAAACGSVTENRDGIATLEIRLPANLYLEQDLPLKLSAVARDRNGDSVAATIRWRTPDTSVVLDGATGIVTARLATGEARVQALAAGEDPLATSLSGLVFRLTARADSLRLVGPDSLTVSRDADPSGPLDVRLVQTPSGTGVAGRPIGFRIIDPTPTDQPTVLLSTGRVADSVLAGSTGGPATPVTVRAATGKRPPDRVVVEVTARRASGAGIPGSGWRIVIRFLHQ